MRLIMCAVLAMAAAACVDNGIGVTTGAVQVDPARDDLEPSYVNGVQCQIVFQGALTPETQYYAIWAVGTRGLVNTTYNTPGRPNLYAIFGTGRPATDTHHVDGYDQFDHYHVAENPADEDEVENRKWDVLTFWPGPNFDAATYQAATNVPDLFAQSAAGVLSPLLTLPEIGFPPFVLNAPIVCPENDDDD